MKIKNVKLKDSDDLIRAIICIIAQLVRRTSQPVIKAKNFHFIEPTVNVIPLLEYNSNFLCDQCFRYIRIFIISPY